MNEYKKKIEEYSSDKGVDCYKIIDMYSNGASLKEMYREFDVTKWTIENFLLLMGLRGSKKHREADLASLMSKLDNDNSHAKRKLDAAHEEIDIMAKELRKTTKSLIRTQGLNAVLRKQTREESKEDEVWEAIKTRLGKYVEPISMVPTVASTNNLPNEGAALFFADQHVGVGVSKTEVGNEYNVDVFSERLNIIIAGFLAQGAMSKNLRLNLIGDSLEAFHHLDQIMNAELDIFEQIDLMTTEYVNALRMLLTKYETIKVVGNVGNHSRISKERTLAKKYLNYETLLYKQLSLVIELTELSGKVTVEYHDSGMYMDNINGTNVLTLHGDVFKTVNDTAINNVKDYALKLFGVTPNVIVVGHFHKFVIEDIGATEVVQVRSLKGFDQYFQNNAFKINKPGQTWLFYEGGVIKKSGNLLA